MTVFVYINIIPHKNRYKHNTNKHVINEITLVTHINYKNNHLSTNQMTFAETKNNKKLNRISCHIIT